MNLPLKSTRLVRYDYFLKLMGILKKAKISELALIILADPGEDNYLDYNPIIQPSKVITQKDYYPREIRIELSWEKIDSDTQVGKACLTLEGLINLDKINRIYPETNNEFGEFFPDYKKLYDDLREAVNTFESSESYKSLPVIISAKPDVPMQHVICVLVECARAGIHNIRFVEPSSDK